MNESSGCTSASDAQGCEEIIEAVYLYLDDECSKERRMTIRQHLEECSPCLAEFGIEQEVRTLVQRCCSQEKAPDPVRDRLLSKLAALDKTSDAFVNNAGNVSGTVVERKKTREA